MTTLELSISSIVFQLYGKCLYWKVDFQIQTFKYGIWLNTTTSMILKINQAPINGTCSVDLLEGYALSTLFTITCLNWVDIDGYITRYEYFAKFLNDSNPIALNYNEEGILYTQLPQGPPYDSYNISLFVQIIDDADAIAVYEIPTLVTVLPVANQTQEIEYEIINGLTSSQFTQSLSTGDLQICAKNIISFTSMLNFETNLTVSIFFSVKRLFSIWNWIYFKRRKN